MSIPLTARGRSWRRFSRGQWLSAARLRIATLLVRKGCYPSPALRKAAHGSCTCPFRFAAAEQFDGTDFLIEGKQIHRTVPMDWSLPGQERLTGIRLRSWSWLRTEGLPKDTALSAILDFIDAAPALSDGADPYALSQRIQHACWWLSYYKITEPRIDWYIADAAARLRWLTEEHLSNNHLLENGFALCRAGVHLGNDHLCQHGLKILRRNFRNQVLPCGSHFEQSPMYQHTLLARTLETIACLRSVNRAADALFLEPIASQMAGWLNYLQWADGTFPVINDSVECPFPLLSEMIKAMRSLEIGECPPVGPGPQVMLRNDRIECCVDASGMEPAHCPGHAHSDALQLLLRVDGHPVLVDPGTSTYAPGARRRVERAVFFHNTCSLVGVDPAEIVGEFRLGRSPKVKAQILSANELTMALQGPVSHTRQVKLDPQGLKVVDEVKSPAACVANFLVDKFCAPVLIDDMLETKFVSIRFIGAERIDISDFNFATDFGRLQPAVAVKVEFRERLETLITIAGSSSVNS